MATVVNFIDVTLRGAAARTVNLASAQILLTPSAPAFHVDAKGVITPETITFTATRIDIDAPLTFNCTGGTLSNATATTVTLAGADMVGSSATVIASATVNGQLYTGPCTISKFSDGKDGKDADGSNLTPADLKAILEGQLTTDELDAALRGRIGLIDGGADMAGSVAARVKYETDQRIAAISQASTDNRTYVQQYTYSQQTINDSFSAFGVSIQAAYQGYADGAAGGALAAAKSFAQTYAYSRADADSALTATANTLRSEFATLNQGTGATVAWVQEYAYSKAQANDAIASATQQLSTTVAGHTSTLEIQGNSISGLGAQYTVKIDNNGYMAGYGLASTPINGVPTSSFIVLADRFAVALPGQAAKYPFVIGTVNGQQVIGLRGDVVLDGTFTFRDATGKPLLGIGVPLDKSLAAPGTLNSDLAPAIDAAKNNLIDVGWWQRGAAIPWSKNGETNLILACSPSFTADFPARFGPLPGPRGGNDAVWYCNETTGDGGAGGGWTATGITLDPTKTYRFVVPARRLTGSGGVYWGTDNVCTLNTTTPLVTGGGPYFVSSASLAAGKWYLLIGYIYPAGSTGNTHDGAGLYDCSTGQLVAAGTNFCFRAGVGGVAHRALQFNASAGAEQIFGRPMVNLVDGTEPSLREYFDSGAVLNTAISIDDSGALNGAGGGQVTLHGMGQDTLRVISCGLASYTAGTVPGIPGLYLNGTKIANSYRSYNLVVIRRSDKAIVYNNFFDVYASAQTDLAYTLNSYSSTPGKYIIVLWTYDEPKNNRLSGPLADALYATGASRAVFGSPQFRSGAAYALIALSGCGEGNGAEAYQGTNDGDPNAWVDVSFNIVSGNLAGVTANYTPKTLQDYGYTGAMDATKGAPSGSYVGGTEAGLVASRALNGDSAFNALPGIGQQIDARLRKDGNDVISGTVGLQSKYALLVGDTTNGVWIGSEGIVLVQGGVIKVTIPLSGDPTFAGKLMAVSIAAAGFIQVGARTWDSGTGVWFGFHNGVPKLAIGVAGGTEIKWDGTQLIINNPTLQLANRSVSISSPSGTSFTHARTTTGGYCGSHTASMSGAASPTYLWTAGASPWGQMIISGATSATCGLSVVGPGGRDTGGGAIDATFDVTCTVSDGGVTKSSTITISVTFQ